MNLHDRSADEADELVVWGAVAAATWLLFRMIPTDRQLPDRSQMGTLKPSHKILRLLQPGGADGNKPVVLTTGFDIKKEKPRRGAGQKRAPFHPRT